jgi:excisionase family DNA binding protein
MMTAKEVANKIHVSQATVSRWVKGRKIPYYLLNGIVRFDEKEVDSWLKNKSVRVKPIA